MKETPPIKRIPCPDCNGAGEICILDYSPLAREPWEWSGPCHTCEGTGEVEVYDLGELGLEIIGPAKPQKQRKKVA